MLETGEEAGWDPRSGLNCRVVECPLVVYVNLNRPRSDQLQSAFANQSGLGADYLSVESRGEHAHGNP